MSLSVSLLGFGIGPMLASFHMCGSMLVFKKEDSKLITYQSGDNRSPNDYLMVSKTDRCLLKDVKVIIR